MAKKYDNVTLTNIPAAGHQIVFDNFKGLCAKIIANMLMNKISIKDKASRMQLQE